MTNDLRRRFTIFWSIFGAAFIGLAYYHTKNLPLGQGLMVIAASTVLIGAGCAWGIWLARNIDAGRGQRVAPVLYIMTIAGLLIGMLRIAAIYFKWE